MQSNKERDLKRERERKQDSWWLRVNDPIFCNKRMVFVNKPKFVMVWHATEKSQATIKWLQIEIVCRKVMKKDYCKFIYTFQIIFVLNF